MSERSKPPATVVIGGGPAGLAAAYELAVRGGAPLLLEKDSCPGGLARTEVYRDFRFDIGGHRFFTRIGRVDALWSRILGERFHPVKRLSRIYYREKYFKYPLELGNAFSNLGVVESFRILFSFLRVKLRFRAEEETFEQWVTNRFGSRLYQTFFKGYTEKVWGIPCSAIQAEWAAQRIKDLTARSVLSQSVFKASRAKTLIQTFRYPESGPGALWTAMQRRIQEAGGDVRLGSEAVRLVHEGGLVKSLEVRNGRRREVFPVDHVISTMPLSRLLLSLDPPPPVPVLEAGRRLRHRSFILVGLILDKNGFFPDQWIYIHEPEVKVGRIQNFKNWSLSMVPDKTRTGLGMEYFCSQGDGTWTMSDADLRDMAAGELEALGLARRSEVEDGVVFRLPHAYPVYDLGYERHLSRVREYLGGFVNFQTIGRNGLHRYNNMDHSMYTGLLAADNIFGASNDVWSVNEDRAYLE